MLRHYTVGKDLEAHYYSSFLKVIDLPWNHLYTLGYENGYLTFYKILSLFTSDPQWMIAIHALFVIGVTGWFIYRNSEDVVISTFMFIATNTWFMYMTMLRQAMAVSLILIALEIWKRKDWKIRRFVFYFLIVLIAVQFHSSAVAALFFPIFDFIPFKRKQILVSLTTMVISFVLYNQIYNAISVFSIGKRDYTDFYSRSESVINLTGLYFVFMYMGFFIIGVYCLVYHRKKPEPGEITYESTSSKGFSDSFLLYMVFSLVVTRIMGLRINIVSRMSFYFIPFIFILIPRALNQFRLAKDKKLIKDTIYILMMIAFIWLGFRNADFLYGTVPYKFFWE